MLIVAAISMIVTPIIAINNNTLSIFPYHIFYRAYSYIKA